MKRLASTQMGFYIVHHPNRAFLGTFIEISNGQVVTLGKAPDTVRPDCFSGTSVSRRHLQIRCEDEGVIVTAKRSRTPTYINEQVTTEQVLTQGDVVRIGIIAMVFSEACPGPMPNDLPGFSAVAYRVYSQGVSAAPAQTLLTLCGRTGTALHSLALYIHRHGARTGAFVAHDLRQIKDEDVAQHLTMITENKKTGHTPLSDGTLFLYNTDHLTGSTLLNLATDKDGTRIIVGRSEKEDWIPKDQVIVLPSLNQRKEDILSWVYKFCSDLGYENVRMETDLAVRLIGYHWPGNEAELQRLTTRLCAEKGDAHPWSLSSELAQRLTPAFVEGRDAYTAEELPKEALVNSLRVHGGHLGHVAEEMGTTVDGVHAQMVQWNIDPSRFS